MLIIFLLLASLRHTGSPHPTLHMSSFEGRDICNCKTSEILKVEPWNKWSIALTYIYEMNAKFKSGTTFLQLNIVTGIRKQERNYEIWIAAY